jgi:hypothetical protein
MSSPEPGSVTPAAPSGTRRKEPLIIRPGPPRDPVVTSVLNFFLNARA